MVDAQMTAKGYYLNPETQKWASPTKPRTAKEILAARTDEEILEQHRLDNPPKKGSHEWWLNISRSVDAVNKQERLEMEERKRKRASNRPAKRYVRGTRHLPNARGFVPNFSAAMELNNSYSRANTRVVNLRGIGLANTEETLGHHPSFSQPFVNPPEGSREGMLHKMRAVSRTGINPYSIPNTPLASQGSIPEIDTSGAQSSLGSLAQEFDNLKTALAQGGFIPDASGSGSGTSTVTNNMSIYSNGGIPTGGSANGPDIAGKVDALIAAVKTNPDLNKQLQNKLLPSITRR
jgi:hypothetical protein